MRAQWPAMGALLLLFVPAAAADVDPFCIIVIEPLDGFRMVRVTVDEELTDDQKAEFWQQADSDGDSLLTVDEAQGFRDGQLQLWPGELGMGDKALLMTVSAAEPNTFRSVHAVSWRQVGHGFYAHQKPLSSITTAADLETQEVREYSFRVGSGVDHVILQGGNDIGDEGLAAYPTEPGPPSPPPLSPSPDGSYCDPDGSCVTVEFVTIQAPPGWTIARVQGTGPEGPIHLEVGDTTVDLPGFDSKSPYAITFVREVENQDQDAPGLQSVAVAALLLAAPALVRRRQ